MNQRAYQLVVSAVFLSLALLNALRAIYGWEASLNGIMIPLWYSTVGALVALYLGIRGLYTLDHK